MLDGTFASGITENGLELAAGSDGSTIRGLVIQNFGASGIRIQGSDNNTIEGNFIGTDATGQTAAPNQSRGIYIRDSDGNTIGGTTAQTRNVISGNSNDGILLRDANDNVIIGNYIGVNADGNTALANNGDGIFVWLASQNNQFGGTATGEGNVIGANAGYGIQVDGTAANNNDFFGNYIGTNAAGDDLGNVDTGVAAWLG